MRAVIQVVNKAQVSVNDEVISRINDGFLVLLAIKKGDTEKQAVKLAYKIANLRIFSDENDKMNKSLLELKKDLLLVSQFTLYGDTTKGNRPSFIEAALPTEAKALIDLVVSELNNLGIKVFQGSFGAHMKVSLLNDGPTTIIIDL